MFLARPYDFISGDSSKIHSMSYFRSTWKHFACSFVLFKSIWMWYWKIYCTWSISMGTFLVSSILASLFLVNFENRTYTYSRFCKTTATCVANSQTRSQVSVKFYSPMEIESSSAEAMLSAVDFAVFISSYTHV